MEDKTITSHYDEFKTAEGIVLDKLVAGGMSRKEARKKLHAFADYLIALNLPDEELIPYLQSLGLK